MNQSGRDDAERFKGIGNKGNVVNESENISANSLLTSLQTLIQNQTHQELSQRSEVGLERAPAFFVKDKTSFKMWKTEVKRWQKYGRLRNN